MVLVYNMEISSAGSGGTYLLQNGLKSSKMNYMAEFNKLIGILIENVNRSIHAKCSSESFLKLRTKVNRSVLRNPTY